MKNLFSKISNFFTNKLRRCPKCKSLFSMVWSSGWRRSYNELCKQNEARSGKRCYECGHFDWDQTCEEYKASLPKWCKAFCK